MGVILLCLCAAGYMIWQVMDIYPEGYTAEQLGIEELYSMRDENGNGTDDYHDFVDGARAYVESGPLYQSIYYAGATRMMIMASAPMSSGMPLRMQGIR